MSTLDDWIADAAQALNLPPDSIPRDLRDGLLDVTREVAHGVTRVAGPLTTYLVGLAVGAGMPPSTAVRTVAELAGDAGDGGSGGGDGGSGAGDGGGANAGADAGADSGGGA